MRPLLRFLRLAALFALLVILGLLLLLYGPGLLRPSRTETPPPADAPAPPDDGLDDGLGGRVVFADGTGAAGATVEVTFRGDDGEPVSSASETGEDGVFRAPDLPGTEPGRAAGLVVERIEAALGPLAASLAAEELGGDTQGPAHVTLRLPATFELSGLVQSAEDRAPVPGAVLEIGGRRATADAEGAFRLTDVPSEVLRGPSPALRLTAPGRADVVWPLPLDRLPPYYRDLLILLSPAK